MSYYQNGRADRHQWWPARSIGRWVTVLVGLAVLGVALTQAAEPYRLAREYRQLLSCERDSPGCFGTEPASIRSWRTYVTYDSVGGDPNGPVIMSPTTHHEVTWQRADGTQESRDVSPDFFAKVTSDQPAVLRIWHDEVVGVEVAGTVEWFLPRSNDLLLGSLYLGWFGLGVAALGWLLGWAGWSSAFGWLLSWMTMSILPLLITGNALAGGRPTGVRLVLAIAFSALFAVPAALGLVHLVRDD